MANPTSVLMVELVMSIDRLIDSARAAQPDSELWPAAVVLSHIADVDETEWLPRLELMVAAHAAHQEAPRFQWWEPDTTGTLERYREVLIDDAGARAMATRIAMLMRLRDLTPQEWAATAQHDTFGEIDVAGLVFAQLAHDEEHRASLVLPRSTS